MEWAEPEAGKAELAEEVARVVVSPVAEAWPVLERRESALVSGDQVERSLPPAALDHEATPRLSPSVPPTSKRIRRTSPL